MACNPEQFAMSLLETALKPLCLPHSLDKALSYESRAWFLTLMEWNDRWLRTRIEFFQNPADL
jgi:hypothetical protein